MFAIPNERVSFVRNELGKSSASERAHASVFQGAACPSHFLLSGTKQESIYLEKGEVKRVR